MLGEYEDFENFDRKHKGHGYWEFEETDGYGRRNPHRGNSHNTRLDRIARVQREKDVRRRNKANGF